MTAGQAMELFNRNGLPLDLPRIGKLLEYERLLLDWNGKINLVSRRETEALFVRHIVGSVSFLFSHQLDAGSALLDVGTGGGLPGMALSIILPDLRITMIDSIRKKITAVTDMAGKLGLANVRVLCGRVEELNTAIVGRFDYIVARGVSSAPEIVGWCAPLLRRHGSGRPGGSPAGAGPGGANSPAKPGLPGDPIHPVKRIPPGSYILLKGGDLSAELAALSDATPGAAVTVRSLTVEGAEEVFTDKKVIIVTP